jgi:hypothetical protein
MGWALMGLLEARMAQKRGKTAQLTYALKVSTSNGAQFEDPQGQDFEEFPEQQQFANEGKWSLIMFQSYLISQLHLYLICMHVSRI